MPTMKWIEQRDDSQISLRIALRAGCIVTFFFVAISFVQVFIATFPFGGVFEVFAKTFFVLLALILSESCIREAKTLENPENIPFLSTCFFYCITVLLFYVIQIFVVSYHLFFLDNFSLIKELQFLFGVMDFSIWSLAVALISGHIPFLIYFLFLKKKIQRLAL